MSKQRPNAQYTEYGQQCYTITTKLTKKLDLSYTNHKKEMITMWCDRDVNYHYNGNHITIYKYIK